MDFLLIAAAFVAAGIVHGLIAARSRRHRVELVLIYLLAGYNGVVMLAVAVFALVADERAAAMLGADAGNVFQAFAGMMYLSMAVISILCIWLRGTYIVGPVVMWTIYFLGATFVHLEDAHGHDHPPSLHGLIRVALVHVLPAAAMLGLAIWLYRHGPRRPRAAESAFSRPCRAVAPERPGIDTAHS
jgi:hypothetical protein